MTRARLSARLALRPREEEEEEEGAAEEPEARALAPESALAAASSAPPPPPPPPPAAAAAATANGDAERKSLPGATRRGSQALARSRQLARRRAASPASVGRGGALFSCPLLRWLCCSSSGGSAAPKARSLSRVDLHLRYLRQEGRSEAGRSLARMKRASRARREKRTRGREERGRGRGRRCWKGRSSSTSPLLPFSSTASALLRPCVLLHFRIEAFEELIAPGARGEEIEDQREAASRIIAMSFFLFFILPRD